MNKTIFPTLSLNRNVIKWEDYLYDMTPVEQHGKLFFKREDYFAPLGYGFVNGSKGRQCLWLFSEYNKTKNPVGIISGTSVHSPQHSFQAVLAKHFGFDSVHVIGATNPKAAIAHENVSIANWFGSRFIFNPKIAYNPVLQRKVKKCLEEDETLSDYFYLEYGITLDHKVNPARRVEQFHYVGSEQVKNIPDHIERLIIPAGSCNSATSILYGIARFKPKNLRDVHLIGIGPNKLDLIEERLEIIEKLSGVPTRLFKRNYTDARKQEQKYNNDLTSFTESSKIDFEYNLHYYDLHSTNYVRYDNTMPYTYEGIDFHPRYEGKVMTFVNERMPEILNEKTLMWIVGSAPNKNYLDDKFKYTLGEIPTKIKEYEKSYRGAYR